MKVMMDEGWKIWQRRKDEVIHIHTVLECGWNCFE
jgi:hypothetical protein